MSTRYIVQFPNLDAYHAAEATEAAHQVRKVRSERRCFITLQPVESVVDAFAAVGAGAPTDAAPERNLEKDLKLLQEKYGAEVFEDYQFELDDEDDLFDPESFGPADADADGPSLDDVLDRINVPDAWEKIGRGEGVALAIVDTGINGNRPEFPAAKRMGGWAPEEEDPWTDWKGHGTMCASIAAGTTAEGGIFNGVAPDAGLIACKTYFYVSELTAIYDYLTQLATDTKLTVVASNSYGRKTGQAPARPPNNIFEEALSDAIEAGVSVFFSAGNNHQRAGGAANACDPTSVWLHKCRSDVCAVATCDLDDQMWYYSSRGPGQFFGEDGTNHKPDVTAPTPRNGRVVYGDAVRALSNGWGTSGACPQAAGVAALVLASRPGLSTDRVFELIRDCAANLGLGQDCQGGGRLDAAAVAAALTGS